MTKITKAQLKKNRKAWITALESGNFEKGVGVLERGGKFCCLGVLASIAGCNRSIDEFSGYAKYDSCGLFAPYKAREFVGLEEDGELIGINDTTLTFKEVVDYIKSEPPGLFKNK